MGNKHSHGSQSSSSSSSKRSMDSMKGPFSDDEFKRLYDMHQTIQAAGKNRKDMEMTIAKLFPLSERSDLMGRRLLALFTTGTGASAGIGGTATAAEPQLSLDTFVDQVASCSRLSSSKVLERLLTLFDDEKDQTLSKSQLTSLLEAIVDMAFMNEKNAQPPVCSSSTIDAVVGSVFQFATAREGLTEEANTVRHEVFVAWTSSNAPLLHTVFKQWMTLCCFRDLRGGGIGYALPLLSEESDILQRAQMVVLSLVSSELQKPWSRLYTSTKDGLSFNRLCYHMLGYNGPTVLICKTSSAEVFGIYADCGWKDSTQFFGGNGCFAFSLKPKMKIIRSKTSGPGHYLYLNTKGFDIPKGIGIGGDREKQRLFFDEDFDNCYARGNCLSYEAGSVVSKTFQVEFLEVWGCGGMEAAHALSSHREETNRMLQKARKVDKAKFAGNEFDKEMFLSKTFGNGADAARIADDEH